MKLQHSKWCYLYTKWFYFSRSFHISAVYRLKSRGPKTLSWGTLKTTNVNWLKFLSNETRCWWLVKKSLNVLKQSLPMPINFNLYNRPWLLIESKTELKWNNPWFISLVKRRLQMICEQQKDISSAKAFYGAKISIGQNLYDIKKFFFINTRNYICYWNGSTI